MVGPSHNVCALWCTTPGWWRTKVSGRDRLTHATAGKRTFEPRPLYMEVQQGSAGLVRPELSSSDAVVKLYNGYA
jgi:hypothetical protein